MGVAARILTVDPARLGLGLLAWAGASVLLACADLPARAPVVDDAELMGRLGFIQGPGVVRGLVEARLGEPVARYEGGRVVSYAVYLSQGRLGLRPGGACFGLMIEYAPDDVIVRQSLVREGSHLCPRE